MNPLWLTFKHADLEEKFEKEQCQQRVHRELIWLCFQLLFEACSLLRLIKLEGIFSLQSLVQFVVVSLPLSICTWNLQGPDAVNRPERRRKILTLAK